MMPMLTYRQINLLVIGISIVSMLFALYFQYGQGLEPCPLCMTQRVFIVLAGFVALLAYMHNPQGIGQRVYAVLVMVAAATGGFFSGRQLWLQSLPEDQVPACGPPLEYIMQNFPLMDALRVLMTGDGNCAEVTWQLLGLSMPAWVLMIFVGLVCLAGVQLFRRA